MGGNHWNRVTGIGGGVVCLGISIGLGGRLQAAATATTWTRLLKETTLTLSSFFVNRSTAGGC